MFTCRLLSWTSCYPVLRYRLSSVSGYTSFDSPYVLRVSPHRSVCSLRTSLVFAYCSHTLPSCTSQSSSLCSSCQRKEPKLSLSAASDVISSSNRSAGWTVMLLLPPPPPPPLLCWASHRGGAGRTNLSLSGGGDMMPGKLGRVWKRFLNWLCGKIRKKEAWKLLILDLCPPSCPPITNHSCRSESWPALRHQKAPDGLIGTVF